MELPQKLEPENLLVYEKLGPKTMAIKWGSSTLWRPRSYLLYIPLSAHYIPTISPLSTHYTISIKNIWRFLKMGYVSVHGLTYRWFGGTPFEPGFDLTVLADRCAGTFRAGAGWRNRAGVTQHTRCWIKRFDCNDRSWIRLDHMCSSSSFSIDAYMMMHTFTLCV